MGLVYFGIPPQLVDLAKTQFGVRAFVETGTFNGDTAALAAKHFERVYTAEFAAARFQKAQQRFANQPNVTCVQGNSPDALRQIAPALAHTPTLFWLDAHWNGDTETREFECPVAEELRVINEANLDAFILVDDARYFMAPPPAPHDPENWPTLAQLIPLLTQGNKRYVMIVDDILVAWPMAAKEHLIAYARARPRAWTMPQNGGGIYYVARQELPTRVITK